MDRSLPLSVCTLLSLLAVSSLSFAQEGRIFRATPDTIGIWEMNDFPVLPGEVLPEGLLIPDLSGNGLDAVVMNNTDNSLVAETGFDLYAPSTACKRVGGGGSSRIEVGEAAPFSFGSADDFSIELFVRRDEVVGGENWGILAGTWHSRALVDDGLSPDTDGAWYGYGFIREAPGVWWLVSSPINEDGTFNPSFNELKVGPFEIPYVNPDAGLGRPDGIHYLVATFDREIDVARVYLDGVLSGEDAIPDASAYITPTGGYEPAKFVFLNGVDDISRGAFRRPPTGFSIDAARVSRGALDPEDIFDNSIATLDDGETIPVDFTTPTQAVLVPSARNVLVDQCVALDGSNSTARDGRTLAKYEWKIGIAADFEEGPAEREISLDAPTTLLGLSVTLRVTDSEGDTSETQVFIKAAHPVPTAQIRASIGANVLGGTSFVVKRGETLTVDGTGSSTPIPANAVACPLADGILVAAPPITDYRWDVDGDGATDATTPSAEVVLDTAGTVNVDLTVVNAAGAEDSTSVEVQVVEPPDDILPAPPGRVFLPTPETIAIWEMNDLEVELGMPIPAETVISDLTGNGLDLVPEGNDGSEILLVDGSGEFEDNTACEKSLPGPARLVVNDDDDQFEMAADQDFSIELFVRRAEQVGGENWGVLAGTSHSRNLIDDGLDPIADGAWYGYGFWLDNDNGGWLFNSHPINPDGTFTPSYNEIKTDPPIPIPAGSHYLVATVDRVLQRAELYLDGAHRATAALPAGQAFITPTGRDHARFMLFQGEDDVSLSSYRPAPSGYAIDAARVMKKALSAEEIAQNHVFISLGVATPPESRPLDSFRRGDTDASGIVDISDPIFNLTFQFVGGIDELPCEDAADVDDSGVVDISDPIYNLTFQFVGGIAPPPAPGPTACGSDPTDDARSCVGYPQERC